MAKQPDPPVRPAASLDLRIEPAAHLAAHVAIPGVFETLLVYDPLRVVTEGALVERALPAPIRKDYDALDDPRHWLDFDVTNWAVIGAFIDGRRIGGAVCAVDTPGVDMLEGRSDLLVLWDIRVAADARQAGVGSALVRAAEQWGRTKSCRELKVETQNVNVAACRLYRRSGFALASALPGAYPECPGEVQLIWRKRIDG